jgi:hypothetical protein
MIGKLSRQNMCFKAFTISGALNDNKLQVRASHCLSAARTIIVRARELRSPELFLLRRSNLVRNVLSASNEALRGLRIMSKPIAENVPVIGYRHTDIFSL